MKSMHFGVRSGKHGAASDHLAYINRVGRYAARKDLMASGYGNMPPFACNTPMLLWRASDRYERKNGSTFRSFTISLPSVLSPKRLAALAAAEAVLLAGPKPFQFALHVPRSSLEGKRNPHVHVVVCDRLPDGIDRSPEQMFKRYNPQEPARGGCRKDSGGRTPAELRNSLIEKRKAAASAINAALAQSGHKLRVDHRSHRERRLSQAPERYLGPARIRKMTKEERAAYVEGRAEKE